MNKSLLLAALVATVALAACGKKEEMAAPAPAPVAEAASAVMESASAAMDTASAAMDTASAAMDTASAADGAKK